MQGGSIVKGLKSEKSKRRSVGHKPYRQAREQVQFKAVENKGVTAKR